jgi:ribosomal protein S18 acetylase RimI-like enzyme
MEGLRLMPSMLRALGGTALRALRWHLAWERHHPRQAHWHLGPVAVPPELQRQGIGSQLLGHCCQHVDGLGEAAYLETDAPAAVRLYQRFGFTVTGELAVYGVPTWFMWRPPQAKRAS